MPSESQRARFAERVLLDGSRLDGDVTGRVVEAKLISDYTAATSIELTLDDQDMLLLTSGLLTKQGKVRKDQFEKAAWARFGQTRLSLDGVFFRLAGVNGVYNADTRQLTLTFEDEIASLMRRHKGPVRWSRKHTTRGQAIMRLSAAVKETRITIHIPELLDKQPLQGTSKAAQDRNRKKGFADDAELTVKGQPITAEQKRNATILLTEADDQSAGERATVAELCAAIGESGIRAIRNQGNPPSPYGGVFQGNINTFAISDTQGQAHSFLLGGKGFQGGGAIALAAAHPDWSAGKIALTVEGSRSNFGSDSAAEGFYGQWETEARAILDAWGGAGKIRVVAKDYTFEVAGKKDGQAAENFWDAAGRIAKEVNFRLFADENILFYVSDDELFQHRPTFVIRPDTAALLGFTFSSDVVNDPLLNEFQLNALVARWVGGPGTVVQLEDLGPFTGRWLLAHQELDLFTEESELTYRRPEAKLPEPAGDVDKVPQTESTPESGSVRALIVAAAKKTLKTPSHFYYEQIRPYPSTLFSPPYPKHVDCSSFVTLLYKAAGAPDPNASGYNGNGNTDTLKANGQQTNDPQPGDLVFYDSPDHVGVYIGGGQVIEIGSPGNPPKQLSAKYRTIAQYRTYDVDG